MNQEDVMQCKRYIISGRVQGVWFRDSTRTKAYELNLCGHAINLPDGSVEVIACGEPVQLELLKAWLWEGPQLARVTTVNRESIPEQKCSGYKIG